MTRGLFDKLFGQSMQDTCRIAELEADLLRRTMERDAFKARLERIEKQPAGEPSSYDACTIAYLKKESAGFKARAEKAEAERETACARLHAAEKRLAEDRSACDEKVSALLTANGNVFNRAEKAEKQLADMTTLQTLTCRDLRAANERHDALRRRVLEACSDQPIKTTVNGIGPGQVHYEPVEHAPVSAKLDAPVAPVRPAELWAVERMLPNGKWEFCSVSSRTWDEANAHCEAQEKVSRHQPHRVNRLPFCIESTPVRRTAQESADTAFIKAMASASDSGASSVGVAAIAKERLRQIDRFNFSALRDMREYQRGELMGAAASYLWSAMTGRSRPPGNWPWAPASFRPTSKRRCLEKAGALIAAELDRMSATGE
jgi:hypothetical protein